MSNIACARAFPRANADCSRAASAALMLPLLRFQMGNGKLTPTPNVSGGGGCGGVGLRS